MPYADPLTDDELAAALGNLNGWNRDGPAISRTVELSGFPAAIDFVNQVAVAAEAADHHPDISIHGYRRVTLTLSTHAAKAITRRDIDLATEIDRLATSFEDA